VGFCTGTEETSAARLRGWSKAVALMVVLCGVMCGGRMGASKSDSGRFIIVHTGGKVRTNLVVTGSPCASAVFRHVGMKAPTRQVGGIWRAVTPPP
jgi:hypothetical protein